jgi:hopanoid-associated phosphorylase
MQVGRPGFVIAATGLAAEARIARRAERVTAVAGGGDEAQLAVLIERSLGEGARGIISFGIAGGLSPEVKSGTLVVGMSVLCGGRSYPANAAWSQRLAGMLEGAVGGAVVGSPGVITEPEAKAALYKATGAIAADMESQVVARIASARGMPFAVLRVVADTADQRLPPAAVNGLKPDGRPDIIGVLRSLASEPAQLPDLIRTAIGAQRAMRGLLRCHRLLRASPGFGFADLG